MIILIKRKKKNSYHDKSDKSDTINLKSFDSKSADGGGDHECVFSNPTYQDTQNFDRSDDDEFLFNSEN